VENRVMRKLSLLVALMVAILTISVDPVRSESQAQTVCTEWTQVNSSAFGLGAGPDGEYSNEEGFEIINFKDQLYVGMEADNSLGARLWRTKLGVEMPNSQADWEEVAADQEGYPFGVPDSVQNDHIDSLAEFKGYLYASTANRSGYPSGTRVFRSASGGLGTWEDAIASYGPGFGDLNNENFKDMQVFQGQLCGGTGNFVAGAQVWCTADGEDWNKKNISGFGENQNKPTNAVIWSGQVFNGGLYFGLQDIGSDPASESDDTGRLYRTTDISNKPTWSEVYAGAMGSRRVEILGILDRYLYISVESNQGIVILRSPSGDPGSWTQANIPGMDGRPENKGTSIDGGTVYNGALYVAVWNPATGTEIWRTAGLSQLDGSPVDWTRASPDGLGDANNIRAELIPFNGNLYAWTTNYLEGQQVIRTSCPSATYLIVLIGDGMGLNQIKAADNYAKSEAVYETWSQYWITTYPQGGGYDPDQAWTDFNYVAAGTTDSAAAGTALFSGVKTANGRINISADGEQRLFSLADKARALGKGTGAVTSVYMSNATPGAWYAHNDDRGNGFAIADEGLWGDPNTTGDASVDQRYGGGHGLSLPVSDVLIGAGHPAWQGGDYVNQAIRDRLWQEAGASDTSDGFSFVERISGSPDGAQRLLEAADETEVKRLVGLFGGNAGNLDYRLADGSGYNPENPTLAEMAQAALAVLGRDPRGFVLMIEGGAIDWASHNHNMNELIGEQIDFNAAAQAVVDWVDSPTNGSNWANTLVMVTADHETGYLTAGPGIFPNQELGAINQATLGLEKPISGSSLRASWDDTHNPGVIDPDEPVYWAWNTQGHTNSLVPMFVNGVGSELFQSYPTQSDPVRGQYLANTDVFKLMDSVTLRAAPAEHHIFLPLVRNNSAASSH
jgi:alkaline phosphatase